MLTIYKPFVLPTIIMLIGYDREVFLLFGGYSLSRTLSWFVTANFLIFFQPCIYWVNSAVSPLLFMCPCAPGHTLVKLLASYVQNNNYCYLSNRTIIIRNYGAFMNNTLLFSLRFSDSVKKCNANVTGTFIWGYKIVWFCAPINCTVLHYRVLTSCMADCWCSPTLLRLWLDELFLLFFANIEDSIPSVRQGAAATLTNVTMQGLWWDTVQTQRRLDARHSVSHIMWHNFNCWSRVCTQQAPVRSRVGIMAVAANVGEPVAWSLSELRRGPWWSYSSVYTYPRRGNWLYCA